MLKNGLVLLVLQLLLLDCSAPPTSESNTNFVDQPFLIVLGIAQDAGFPQAACRKDCCKKLWDDKNARKMVSCLGLVDPASGRSWLFDATPDFKDQLHILEAYAPLSGIFLTHAHIGHYTGLMHLGREVMGASEVPVYAMPLMREYLENNGPWSQLVELKNIKLIDLEADLPVQLTDKISVTPLKVPHRDEFSETVGYQIEGPEKNALFIPDIDKWDLWDKNIIEMVESVDYAFLDGSFYQNGEIPGRDMSEIPHPFIEESMLLFFMQPEEETAKIHFIHFNHTNPVLQRDSEAAFNVEIKGFNISKELSKFSL